MSRVINIMLILVMILALVGSSTIFAAYPSKGMKGSNNEILSRVTTYSGTGGFGNVNGDVSEASYRTPESLAVLSDGSVLVSDSRNHVIRQIARDQVTTYAGLTLEINELGLPEGGWNDDKRSGAVFNSPAGITVDEEDNIYLADAENHMIRKLGTDGQVTTLAGNGVIGNEDGTGEAAAFYHPQDVAVAKDGAVYVADTLNHLIRKITPDGIVTTLNALSERAVEVVEGSVETAGDFQDGSLEEAKFNEPSGIAIDSKGNLYISDTGNHLIRYIDLLAGTVSTVAGLKQSGDSFYAANEVYAQGGYLDGAASEAMFLYPKGITTTDEGGLLIADSMNHSIRYLMNDEVITLAGDPSQGHGNIDGINGDHRLHNPTDVAVLPNGNIIIADSYNHLIRKYTLYRLPHNLPQNGTIKVVLNDEIITLDLQPKLINGRTMIPVRALSEQMQYQVGYDTAKKAVYLTGNDTRIEFFVGQLTMTIEQDGSRKAEKTIDIAPYIHEGSTYVPVRFLSEAFGLDVQWNQNNKTVILRETNK